MVSPAIITLYIILAIIIFMVQMFLLKKSNNKMIHSIPLFTMILLEFTEVIYNEN